MDGIINEIIREKLADKGLNADERIVETVIVDIKKEEVPINIGNSFLILLSKELPISDSANLKIKSEDNIFSTSTIQFRHLDMHRYQVFEKDITVITRNNNYNPVRNLWVFKPYSLEFLKVTPKYSEDNV